MKFEIVPGSEPPVFKAVSISERLSASSQAGFLDSTMVTKPSIIPELTFEHLTAVDTLYEDLSYVYRQYGDIATAGSADFTNPIDDRIRLIADRSPLSGHFLENDHASARGIMILMLSGAFINPGTARNMVSAAARTGLYDASESAHLESLVAGIAEARTQHEEFAVEDYLRSASMDIARDYRGSGGVSNALDCGIIALSVGALLAMPKRSQTYMDQLQLIIQPRHT